jgi:hypothetical protein
MANLLIKWSLTFRWSSIPLATSWGVEWNLLSRSLERDSSAGNALNQVVYTELRRIAARFFGVTQSHNLEPTALDHAMKVSTT